MTVSRECSLPHPSQRRDAVIEGADNDVVELPRGKLRSSRRMLARHTKIDNYNEDLDEEVAPGEKLLSQAHPSRRRCQLNRIETEGLGRYQPSEVSEKEQDGDAGDAGDEIPSPHKRRKSTKWQSRSIDNASNLRTTIDIASEDVGPASDNTTYHTSVEEEINAAPLVVEALPSPSHHLDTPPVQPDEEGLSERVECGNNESRSGGDDVADLPRAELVSEISREILPADTPRLPEDAESEQNRAMAQDAQSSDGMSSPPPLHRCDAGTDAADKDETELHRVMPRSGRRRPARRSRIVDYNEDAEDEAVEAGDRLISQMHLRRRRRRRESTETESLGVYQPSEASEIEQDDNDGDDNDKNTPPPPPHKRRRTARRQNRSVDDDPSQREVGSPNLAWAHFTPPHMLSPPHSQDSDASEDIDTVQIPAASFQEWPLGNAVLKRAVINGEATFQLEFTWDPHIHHKHRVGTTKGMQAKTLAKSRRSTRRQAGNGSSWTHEEDDLIIKLKNQGLWKDVYKRFREVFPEKKRSIGAVQVHFCTKLNGKN